MQAALGYQLGTAFTLIRLGVNVKGGNASRQAPLSPVYQTLSGPPTMARAVHILLSALE